MNAEDVMDFLNLNSLELINTLDDNNLYRLY